MKATRDALADCLPALFEKNEKLIALDPDLGKATKLDCVKDKFPDRYFAVGIAENNAIGIASGLASQGFTPIVASFESFLTGRFDTISCSIAYSNRPVILIGTHGGLAIGRDGVTQMGLFGITLMRALPNMTIYNPGSYTEACDTIKKLCEEDLKGPVYLRLGRQPVDIDLDPIYSKLFKAPKLTIYSTGCISHEVIKAIKIVNSDRIRFYHVNRIKPMGLVPLASGKIITIEDHVTAGGFGSAIEDYLEGRITMIRKIGIPDKWAGSGKPEDLYKKYGLDATSLAEVIRTYVLSD